MYIHIENTTINFHIHVKLLVFHVVLMFSHPQVVKDLVTIFPVLRDWLAEFLNTNCIMTASDIGHNLLIEQVLYANNY